jgi:hypothetical protein
MYSKLRVSALAVIGSVSLAGCAGGLDMFGGNGSSDVTTSSVAQTQAQRVDPACGNLALEIDTLRREGVADKIERAAAKKYKMTSGDLAKASQLNKANGEFQSKCSTLPRSAAVPDAVVAPATKSTATAAKAAAAPAVTNATR